MTDLLFIEQGRVDVLQVRRTAEGWEERRLLALEDEVDLAAGGVKLPLAEIYDLPQDS